jgi:hypothetical protein
VEVEMGVEMGAVVAAEMVGGVEVMAAEMVGGVEVMAGVMKEIVAAAKKRAQKKESQT